MDKQREISLVEQCRDGDRNALGVLVDEYHGPIYNAAFRMLGNAEEAADVTQSAFLKALENIDDFDSRYRFFSWLYRIAMNAAIDSLKRGSRFSPLNEDLLSDDVRVSATAEQAQTDQHLQTALMHLSEEHRSVIVLRYFSELSYQEIGQVLEIPDRTVKSRLFTARQRLRQGLEKQGVLSA